VDLRGKAMQKARNRLSSNKKLDNTSRARPGFIHRAPARLVLCRKLCDAPHELRALKALSHDLLREFRDDLVPRRTSLGGKGIATGDG
jgi:hypothetical protein